MYIMLLLSLLNLLMQLAEILFEKEVLNYKDIVDILGPIPYEKKFHQHHELQDMWCKNYPYSLI